ncbi:MAG: helix-turn-helix domain-containing protein [Muribaculaceae bacterium]
MDIVQRIKAFISSSGISVSQFADTSFIPRPTVSQLLNGRNKKVSDEIITKIHKAYPKLSISWLLFGEGDMYIGSSSDSNTTEQSNDSGGQQSFFSSPFRVSAQGFEETVSDDFTGEVSAVESIKPNDISLGSIIEGSSPMPDSSSATDRKVVNIIVFYSDNSFEYFRPAQK